MVTLAMGRSRLCSEEQNSRNVPRIADLAKSRGLQELQGWIRANP
jgi:hypothetical protein